ncbi:hypothetical protein ACRN9C_20780 [Shewanella frigidimarina]|uniref:hypothetical protein n=1 Tax=Shewanella frigidimarina TaxID=56812 RepID=UPI003D78EEF8
MIELYESKLKFVDNMKESGLFNAIEQRIIKLSKELVSSSLNQNTEDCREEQSVHEFGDLNLLWFQYQSYDNEESVTIILNRVDLIGEIKLDVTVQRLSGIIDGPANVKTNIEVKNINNPSVTVVKRSENTHTSLQLEALLSYAHALEAQGIVFEDVGWTTVRFDDFGSIVLVSEFLKKNQHSYIDEYDMLNLSRFVADDVFDFELPEQTTFEEAINYLNPFYHYLSNTYMSSLDGYIFGERVAHSVLMETLLLAKKPEQLQLLAQRLVYGLRDTGVLVFSEILGKVESIVQELRDLTCDEELPVAQFIENVKVALNAYYD